MGPRGRNRVARGLALMVSAPVMGAGLGLAGCAGAPATLYRWDGYAELVHADLRGDGDGPARHLQRLDRLAERARAEGRALPPGFRAHRGWLLWQLGDAAGARQALLDERAAFPESAGQIAFLLARGGAGVGGAPDAPVAPGAPGAPIPAGAR